MSDILKSFTTKKGKKEFSKLSSDAKSEILQAAIMEKLSPIMAKEISKSMISGIEQEREYLYNKYVSVIDNFEEGDQSWIENVNVLLSFLRMKHLDYVTKKRKEDCE